MLEDVAPADQLRKALISPLIAGTGAETASIPRSPAATAGQRHKPWCRQSGCGNTRSSGPRLVIRSTRPVLDWQAAARCCGDRAVPQPTSQRI
jgi:hypothetical protein